MSLPPLYKVMSRTYPSVWMQSDLFSNEGLHALLHGALLTEEGTRQRGKTLFSLVQVMDSAIALSEKGTPMGKAALFADVTCIIPREPRTRWDVRLTQRWVDKMRTVNVAFMDACKLVESVKRTDARCKKCKVDWHLQRVSPGSPDQKLHVDDTTTQRGRRCYYTLIVPLTDNPLAGGTKFPTLGVVFTTYGGAVLFDGSVEHAGVGNRSHSMRYFLYAALYTGQDANC